MKRRGKSNSGVITIFVSLMLVSFLSLGTLVIEASRYQAAKNQLTDATTSSATSMIAAYNAQLYERYGLLAIDKDGFTNERVCDYLDFNADLSPTFLGNNVTKLYSVSDVELQGLYNLTYPSALKRQLLARAKYHVIPQDYSLNYYNMNEFFADLQEKCLFVADSLSSVADGKSTAGSSSDVNPAMLTALNSLFNTFNGVKKYDEKCNVTLSSGTSALLPSKTGTVEDKLPEEDQRSITEILNEASTVIGASADDLTSSGKTFSQTDVSINASSISDMTEDIKDVASIKNVSSTAKKYAKYCVKLAQSINAAINMLDNDKEGNLLLNSYISEYFSNRNFSVEGYAGPAKGSDFQGENANFVSGCVEYIFGGNANEQDNQDCAYDYAFAIRLINNLYYTINNSTTFKPNNNFSCLSHIAWGYYETFSDMELLTKYSAIVPMNKYNMILNVNDCGSVASAFASKSFVNAMTALGVYNEGRAENKFYVAGSDESTYRDTLALALWFFPNSEKLLRVADLIQLETRYREQYIEKKTASFLMCEQNTYCRVKCTGKLNSILPIVSASDSGVNGISFASVKYIGY